MNHVLNHSIPISQCVLYLDGENRSSVFSSLEVSKELLVSKEDVDGVLYRCGCSESYREFFVSLC